MTLAIVPPASTALAAKMSLEPMLTSTGTAGLGAAAAASSPGLLKVRVATGELPTSATTVMALAAVVVRLFWLSVAIAVTL